jgi:acetate kinase
MTAIENGKCVDTSMGLGPMNGLMMGTRCGDIDQSVIFHLVSRLGYTIEQVNSILNKQSGMLGLTGFSDMRDIKREIENGNGEAKLAYEMYAYRIRKYIGSYTAVLNGLDAIVFTGGVGENDALMRKMVCSNLEYLGVIPDDEKNNLRTMELHEINSIDSKVKLLVVPTNEELEIAHQCYQLISNLEKEQVL